MCELFFLTKTKLKSQLNRNETQQYQYPKTVKLRKNLRNSNLYQFKVIQGWPRWQSKAHMQLHISYFSLTVTEHNLVQFSRYWCIKLENCLFSPPHPTQPLFDTPDKGETISISGCKLPEKLGGMRLLYSKKYMILTLTIYDWSTLVTDIQTGGAPKSNPPPGKILCLWNWSRYIHQIYWVYRQGFKPHLQILLK